MRAAGITEYRGAVTPLELPTPSALAADQMLIEVYAAGVANWDEIVRNGGWNVGSVPPMALGVEASGIVRRVGSNVSRFSPGDEVLTHSVPLQQGTWAELYVAREGHVAHKPSSLAWSQAALLPVPALTAYQVLSEALAIKPGDALLIHGAGGITGGMLVALASDMRARVIATSGPRSADRVREYGADVIVDYHTPDWQSQVRAASGGRLGAVANAVPGAASTLMSMLDDGGRLATITGDPPAAERGIQVIDYYVHPDGAALEQIAARFAERGLSIPLAPTYELSTADIALAEAVSGKSAGGIAIKVRE
jgi:NADPH:quinone reductase-like Zn-dependent oxidoreductase